ncbi:MAG: hypothetical protein JRD93_18545 [Deltaproteobacteria bacterium]|nr:hypothetical protein [Deltaproteobacteria bacterium]
MSKKIWVGVITVLTSIVCFNAFAAQNFTPPYTGAYVNDHSWEATDLGSGLGIEHRQINDEESFLSECTVFSITDSLVLYGHAAMAVVDDYRIPLTVSTSGKYKVVIDISFDGMVSAVSKSTCFAATSAASEGNLYTMLRDGSGNLVSEIQANYDIWNEEYGVVNVLTDNAANAAEAIATLGGTGAIVSYASAASYILTLYSAMQTIFSYE